MTPDEAKRKIEARANEYMWNHYDSDVAPNVNAKKAFIAGYTQAALESQGEIERLTAKHEEEIKLTQTKGQIILREALADAESQLKELREAADGMESALNDVIRWRHGNESYFNLDVIQEAWAAYQNLKQK